MTTPAPGHPRSWIAGIGLLALLAVAAPADAPSLNTALAAQATPAASPAAVSTAATIAFAGLVTHPERVSVADLQQLPQETVSVTYESSQGAEDHTFTGVRLYDALEHVGIDVPADARNPLLHLYLVVSANDGYQIVLSGGEIDPNFGHAPILLAWEQDGQPLAGDQGPLRLVVPGDIRGGRYVHGIVSIDVRAIDDTTS